MKNIEPLFSEGPWREDACEVRDAGGSPICEMLARHEDAERWGRPHADANSYLICAAPDLLAALVSASEWLSAAGRGLNPVDRLALEKARSEAARAINKAIGKG